MRVRYSWTWKRETPHAFPSFPVDAAPICAWPMPLTRGRRGGSRPSEAGSEEPAPRPQEQGQEGEETDRHEDRVVRVRLVLERDACGSRRAPRHRRGSARASPASARRRRRSPLQRGSNDSLSSTAAGRAAVHRRGEQAVRPSRWHWRAPCPDGSVGGVVPADRSAGAAGFPSNAIDGYTFVQREIRVAELLDVALPMFGSVRGDRAHHVDDLEVAASCRPRRAGAGPPSRAASPARAARSYDGQDHVLDVHDLVLRESSSRRSSRRRRSTATAPCGTGSRSCRRRSPRAPRTPGPNRSGSCVPQLARVPA